MEPTNRAEVAIRSDQRRMAVASIGFVAVLAYVANHYNLWAPFRPSNAALFWLSILWFALSAVETFNKRMGQIEAKGDSPPYMEYKGLHLPIMVVQYALLTILVYLNWRWALTLYIFTLALAVSPILETLGKMLMTPWLKRGIAGH